MDIYNALKTEVCDNNGPALPGAFRSNLEKLEMFRWNLERKHLDNKFDLEKNNIFSIGILIL